MSRRNDDANLKIRVYTISVLMAGTLSLALGVLGVDRETVTKRT